ncbi:hypothetical protein ACROYT_G043578 [Oculina patagonica]
MGEQEGASASISPKLNAILDAQRNAILTAVNTQIQGLQSNLLQAQSDLAAQIASDLQPDNYVFKKKGKVVKTSNSALKALESGNVPNTKEELNRESSKTDEFRDGAWITIARSDRETCPVKALEKYIVAAKIDLCEELPLFRALSSPQSTSKDSRSLSYTRAREIIKDAFKDITDVSCISLHSLRAGGATTAANAGIVDRLFKRRGR